MKKFALFASIIVLVFLGFKSVKTSEASDFTDCSSISGYSLTQGASCKTEVNSPVVFNFKARSPGGYNLTWSIDYGDGAGGGFGFSCPAGSPNNNLSVNHVWKNPGIYNVKLAVSNCMGGVASASFNVVVELPAISASLEAVPSSLGYGGGPSTIFVHTAGATSCYVPSTSDMKEYIDPMTYKTIPLLTNYISFSSGVSLTGENKSAGDGASIKVSPVAATAYNISCTGPGGTVDNSVKIAVDTNAPPTAKISINPSAIPLYSDATLTWSSTNSKYCVAGDGNAYSSSLWSGKKDTSGTLKISGFHADGSGSFSIKCFSSGGKSVLAFTGYDIASSSPTNDAFGLQGVFKLANNYNPSVYLTWNPVLPLGHVGGYKVYRAGFGLVGAIRTDSASSLSDTTSLYDMNNVNCPSSLTYKVVPFSYDSNWNAIGGDWNDSNASKPFTVISKYPCK